MLYELQNFYLEKQEPQKSCFYALRDIITEFDESITEHWKYKLPFFILRINHSVTYGIITEQMSHT